MIKLTRIDYRLIHGQVAMAWTQSIGADCLLVASDTVVHDEMRKATLKLAKPSGCKLVIKSVSDAITALNAGVTDKYRLLSSWSLLKMPIGLQRAVRESRASTSGAQNRGRSARANCRPPRQSPMQM